MKTLHRIFSEGFRSFFLAAPLWALLAGLVWELWLGVHAVGGMVDLPGPGMAPHLWHGHEMVFGYGVAAVTGFLLTAVAGNARGLFIGGALAVWAAGRLALWFSGALGPVPVAMIDLAFLPLLAGRILAVLIRRPNPQQAVFLLFVAALWLGNLVVHLDWLGLVRDSAYLGLRIGLMALCGLIAVLGGRVTPGFIKNAMKRAGQGPETWPSETPRLNRVTLALAVVLPWSLFVPHATPVIAAALALTQGARMARWRIGFTTRDPLLWVLGLGQGGLVAGLALWALAEWNIGSEVAALHVLALGAVGGMTLAVMSRATLAHTGRALVATGALTSAYALMAGAMVIRWAGSTWPDWYFPLNVTAGAFWLVAFTLFLAGLGEALVTARPVRPAPPPPRG